MPKTPEHLIDEARLLRISHRLSNYEISERTGIPVGTLSPYLKDIPLTKQEILEKQDIGRAKGRKIVLESRSKIRDRHVDAAGYDKESRKFFSTNQKCAISELAVRQRISQIGLVSMVPDTPGLKYDIVSHDTHKNVFVRIQVKSAYWPKHGSPSVVARSRKGSGFIPYDPNDYDIMVAYMPQSGSFYIITSQEADQRISTATISLRNEDMDRWDKILKRT